MVRGIPTINLCRITPAKNKTFPVYLITPSAYNVNIYRFGSHGNHVLSVFWKKINVPGTRNAYGDMGYLTIVSWLADKVVVYIFNAKGMSGDFLKLLLKGVGKLVSCLFLWSDLPHGTDFLLVVKQQA